MFKGFGWLSGNHLKRNQNASVGKTGEFAFATWAGENELAISHIEVNKNDGPDKYDFLGNGYIKIDVKTYHDNLTTGSKHNRKHWNISSTSVKDSKFDFIQFRQRSTVS